MLSQSFLKLPFTFDVEKLQKDLACVKEEEWVAHPNSQAYEGSWSVTSLMSTNAKTTQIIASENQDYFETPLMKRTSYIHEVPNTFETQIEAVRFMKLGVGSYIKDHCDKGAGFEEGSVRIHIPIMTNEAVEFNLNGQLEQMEAGQCYYIDAHNPHSVINKGKSDRVHLLIDCHVNEWLKAIFEKGGFVMPIYKYGDKSITDENVDDIIASLKALNTETSLQMAQKLERKKG